MGGSIAVEAPLRMNSWHAKAAITRMSALGH